MVASRQVEIPFYRCVGRQRGRGFGALAQVIGRFAIQILHNYIVPAAKRVGADLLEIVGNCCARNCRGCWWWKEFQDSCKKCGKTVSENTVG